MVSAVCRNDGAVFRLVVSGNEHAPFEEVGCRWTQVSIYGELVG